MEKIQVYKLSMDFDGLLAVIKNHDKLIKLFLVVDKQQSRPGYTRYRLTDDTLVDINSNDIALFEL